MSGYMVVLKNGSSVIIEDVDMFEWAGGGGGTLDIYGPIRENPPKGEKPRVCLAVFEALTWAYIVPSPGATILSSERGQVGAD